LRNGGWREPSHKHVRKAEEANFKPKFPFFTSISTAEGHVCGVEFNGFMELLVLLRFGTFCFEEKAIWGVTSGQRSMAWSGLPFHFFRARSKGFE